MTPKRAKRLALGLSMTAIALGLGWGGDAASSQSGPGNRDPQGRPFDAPAGIPIENGRVQVISYGQVVGWVDAFEVFGPPAGTYNGPPPAAGPHTVYERSDGTERVGELGPGGFRRDGAPPSYETTETTAVYSTGE